jgi:hypothetical protein
VCWEWIQFSDIPKSSENSQRSHSISVQRKMARWFRDNQRNKSGFLHLNFKENGVSLQEHFHWILPRLHWRAEKSLYRLKIIHPKEVL